MIARYSRSKLKNIWSNKSKYNYWLKIEILAIEAYSKFNKQITTNDIKKIKQKARVNLSRIKEIEKNTKHDVIAFTRAVSETLGQEKKWIHYGLTSTDVVDSAQSCQLKEANKIILNELQILRKIIKKLAIKHKDTYQIGRTHGIHAEISTFGYKIANWFEEINRNIKRFKNASSQIEIAKISGAVGNYANTPLEIQDYIAQKLGLTSSKISSQTLQRDRHAEYIFIISLIGSSLDKFATEIRHLQRTEVAEVQEGFSEKQKGSSAMPHKKNPISSENISGLSRILRGFVLTANENISLWHERDISHSSSERIILVDATILIDYMINKMSWILTNLVVNKEKMKENIFITNGINFSQRAMLFLIEKKDWTRQKAYDIIQLITIKSHHNKIDFRELLVKNKLFTKKEVNEIYKLSYYKRNINKVFKRLGLLD